MGIIPIGMLVAYEIIMCNVLARLLIEAKNLLILSI